jgi:NitT/TauT family transport system substrate-binding protein
MRLRDIALALAIAVLGTAALYGFHRWRKPYRTPPPVVVAPEATVVRVGYFPNVTHAQAVVGLADGTFARAAGVKVEPYLFNAGPSAVEALFAGSLDMTYVGPNPAINAQEKAPGKAVVVCGAATGGAALVVRGDSGIEKAADFRGKKVATPQLGNTQDVAARAWFKAQNVPEVRLVPVRNPDQLTAFHKKEIDAAWTVEPWVSRLVREAGGKVLLDERTLWPEGRFATTVLLVETSFLERNPELVKRWLRAHVELTQRFQETPAETRKALNAELGRLTGKELPAQILDDALGRFSVTWDPASESLSRSARQAFELGFLGKKAPDLAGLFRLGPLNDVLRETGRPPLK